jgi:hypothetical protein
MDVIHFTRAATDPLKGFDASGASFLPLADGQGDTHISCLHLEMGGKIEAPSITHAAALLIVHGRVTIESDIGAQNQLLRRHGCRVQPKRTLHPDIRNRRHLASGRIPRTHRPRPRHLHTAKNRGSHMAGRER